jgi:NAD-dependent dihydropyrimidine dehydrogenase PreA subunit
MPKRKIIKINEIKCNGCGQCIPNCPEGAIQVIDGKARLISDLFCDGLGACIGHCPKGAIIIEEREAEEYNEKKVMANIIKQGKNVIKAHLEHLKEHAQDEYLKQAVDFLNEKGIENPLKDEHIHSLHKHSAHACPGAKIMDFRGTQESRLGQWPIQLILVPPFAPFLDNTDLLIAADCVGFAYTDFHEGLLKGKTLLVGCPKFDDMQVYTERLTWVFKQNNIKSVTYAHMEVPCCFGLVGVINGAISASGKNIPFKEAVISIKGERLK